MTFVFHYGNRLWMSPAMPTLGTPVRLSPEAIQAIAWDNMEVSCYNHATLGMGPKNRRAFQAWRTRFFPTDDFIVGDAITFERCLIEEHVMMAAHPRLGQNSPLHALHEETLRAICRLANA